MVYRYPEHEVVKDEFRSGSLICIDLHAFDIEDESPLLTEIGISNNWSRIVLAGKVLGT